MHTNIQSSGRISRLIEVLALETVGQAGLGNTVQALTALRRALPLAAERGYVRTFVDLGASIAPLLRQAAAERIVPEFVAALLAAMSLAPSSSSQGQPSVQGAAVLVEPLSERELEILRLIAAGRSNREIAAELIVALGTVKKHLNNIFGKLGVSSRTQAVAYARELGLL